MEKYIGWWPEDQEFPRPYEEKEIAQDWSNNGKAIKIEIRINIIKE